MRQEAPKPDKMHPVWTSLEQQDIKPKEKDSYVKNGMCGHWSSCVKGGLLFCLRMDWILKPDSGNQLKIKSYL